ncbi:MAG: hypothetical protein OEY36_11395 [Gammaproteobacteria bacterium]|nr:hypothetical protein [Gammaproteobacteria bacterium]
MIQHQNKNAYKNVSHISSTNFNGSAVEENAVEITEGAMQQSLRELESVWMKHHNHYAEVLDCLMQKVSAARGVI